MSPENESHHEKINSLLLAVALLPLPAAAEFGLHGIVAGQTARLSVVNTSAPAAPVLPCQVELRFVGADGQTFVNANGLPLVSQVAPAPAAAASLDLPAPSYGDW